jgi:putative hemolysin
MFGRAAVLPVGSLTEVPASTSRYALRCGAYGLRLAANERDREAAYRLRFLVFNLELNEGLASAYQTGRDTDEFDPICDHLLVEHIPSREVIGTYRVQTGEGAARNRGFYSAREFDLAPYERLRPQLLELGRACIHRDHRSFEVLCLLWKGLANYALEHRARYMIGCSSLTSQDPAEGSAMYHALRDYLVSPGLQTRPIGEFAFPLSAPAGRKPSPPKLLRTYLAVGARICGAPAIDREFKTIDFLTLLDLERIPASMRARFLGR